MAAATSFAAVTSFVAGVVASSRQAALADAALQARLAAMDDGELVEAIRDDDDSLAYKLPDGRYSRELCLEIVAINGKNLQYIPESVRSQAGFERDAALAEMWAFGYVSPASKTEELLLEVIDKVDFDVAMFGESWAVPRDLLTPTVLGALKAKAGDAAVNKWIETREDM